MQLLTIINVAGAEIARDMTKVITFGSWEKKKLKQVLANRHRQQQERGRKAVLQIKLQLKRKRLKLNQ